ncbi:hypothetical protein AVEN_88070-1 [Araneus ventricosus]|uniref:Uncharacterized protein n=1 Tax=Araneus ventricosus TaxID=182803 RepID=A0A4Y2UG20_ARAVE|nr:hypothetical protein AVEN_88070-1 [Araneus ventricosus]
MTGLTSFSQFDEGNPGHTLVEVLSKGAARQTFCCGKQHKEHITLPCIIRPGVMVVAPFKMAFCIHTSVRNGFGIVTGSYFFLFVEFTSIFV